MDRLKQPERKFRSGANPCYGIRARDIQKLVAEELRGNVRIASPEDLLSILHPGPEADIKAIANIVMAELYDEGQLRWAGYPDHGAKEVLSYKPTVQVANAVHAASIKIRDVNGSSVCGEWIDTHSIAPKSRSKDHPKIEPDIVFVSRTEDAVHLQEAYMIDEDKEYRKQLRRIWWLQVHTLIEAKRFPGNSDEHCGYIQQLCSYMRTMFREQLDRRFIVALLLCGDELTMWLCDRSGLIGTLVPINIHTDPIKFVQVLSSFSLLPAHRIGWDPTMLVYQPSGDHLPSYRIPMDPRSQDFEPSLYHVNWVINMPTPTGRCDFLTVRAILATPSERIASRATIVWEVVKLKDFENANAACLCDDLEIFVLKQSWQYVEEAEECGVGVKEANLYQKSGLDIFYSAELVRVNDEHDTTKNIRNGISVTTYQEAISNSISNSSTDTLATNSRSEHDEPLLHVEPSPAATGTKSDSMLLLGADSSKVDIRAHIRLLLRVTGVPVKFFADLVELVQTFLDCIKQHEQMCKNGVLHRDVSAGNMLIRIERGSAQTEAPQKVGQLIDLDHAKQVEIKDRFNFYTYNGPTDDDVGKLQALLDFVAERSIVDRAWRYFGVSKRARTYLDALAYHMPQSLRPSNWDEEKYLSTKDLGWPEDEDATLNLFDFSAHESKGFHRTGTVPFMSAEVLSSDSLFYEFEIPDRLPAGRQNYFHDAVHDSESLLLVLVHNCLTRGDPAEGHIIPGPGASLILHTLFDSRNIEGIKGARSRHLRNITAFEKEVLPHFSPYFAPLRNLVLKWHWTLYNAYKFRAIEYHEIHNIVKNLLQETLDDLRNAQSPQEKEKSKVQKEKRYREWVAQRKFPKKPTIAQDPVVSTSDLPSNELSLGPRTRSSTAAARCNDITPDSLGEITLGSARRKAQQAASHDHLASSSDPRTGQRSSGHLKRPSTRNEIVPSPGESATRGQIPQKRSRRR